MSLEYLAALGLGPQPNYQTTVTTTTTTPAPEMRVALAVDALTLTRELILALFPETRRRNRIAEALTDAMEDVRELPA